VPRRFISIVLILLVVLMGLPLLTPAMSASMQSCPSCWVMLLITVLLTLFTVTYLRARGATFAALCHPLPLEPPPRR
jgi:hypothetical protein